MTRAMRARRLRAFTLIELIAIIVVLAILSGVAVPRYYDIADRARSSTVSYTLKTLRRAIIQYRIDHGALPPDQVTGVVPPEIMPYLQSDSWAQTVPGVGRYNWEGPPGWASTPAVSVAPTAVPVSPLTDPFWFRVDQMIDDGVLGTGLFRFDSGSSRYLFYLDPP